jgi:hypothetical protein
MVQVYTGVNGLKGTVGGIAFLVTPNHVIAHMQGNNLLEMEHILNHYDRTTSFFSCSLTIILG